MSETTSTTGNPVKKKLTVKVIIMIIVACLLYGVLCGFRSDFSVVIGIMEASSETFSYTDLQIANTICKFVTAFASPLVAMLTLKRSNFFVLTLGMITTIVGIFVIACANSFPLLVIGLGILFAFGTAALSFGIIFAIISPLLEERAAIVVSTIFTIVSTTFAVFFSPLIQLISDAVGYQNMLFFFCIVLICSYPLVLVLSRIKEKEVLAKEKKEIRFRDAVSIIFKNKLFYVLLGFSLVLGITSGYTTHFYTGLTNLYYSSATVSLAYSVLRIAAAVSATVIAIFVVKIRKTLHFGAFVFILFALSLITILIFVTNSLPILILIYMLAFITAALYPLSTLIVRREFAPVLLATVLCFVSFFQKIGSGLNGIIGSIIYETDGNFNLLVIMEFIIAFTFAGVLLIYAILEKKNRKKSPEQKNQ